MSARDRGSIGIHMDENPLRAAAAATSDLLAGRGAERRALTEIAAGIQALGLILEAVVAGQASIDAAVAALTAGQAAEAQAVSTIQADVTAIQAQLAAGGTGSLDTDELDAAVASYTAGTPALVDAVNSLTDVADPPAADGSPSSSAPPQPAG